MRRREGEGVIMHMTRRWEKGGGDHERKGVFLKATAQQEMQSHSVECTCVFVQGSYRLQKHAGIQCVGYVKV